MSPPGKKNKRGLKLTSFNLKAPSNGIYLSKRLPYSPPWGGVVRAPPLCLRQSYSFCAIVQKGGGERRGGGGPPAKACF